MKSKRAFLYLIYIFLTTKMLGNPSVNTFDSSTFDLDKTIETAWNLSNVNPDSALKITEKALEISTYYDLKKEQAELLRVKGVIYFYKVDYVGAFNLFIKSRDLNVEIGNKVGEAAALNNISLIYRQQGFYEKALEMDLHILKMRRSMGDSARVAQSLNNLAVTYRDLKKLNEALKYYRQAIQLSNVMHIETSLPMYYNNIGSIYLETNQLDSAYFYFHKSLRLGKLQNNKQMISNSMSYLGDYYNRKKEYLQAVEVLEPSLALANEIGIVYEIESAAEHLHIAYAGLGRYSEAYSIHKLYKQMGDSANNIQTMKKITEFDALTVFERERELQQLTHNQKEMQSELLLHKEKQIRNIALIVVLSILVLFYLLYVNFRRKSIMNIKLMQHRDEILAQKEEIESQRDEIEQLNITKDKFFTIIAHDLKNPISGVYRLSEIMDTNYEFIDSSKLKEYISQIHFSTKKTYELLENLLRWAMVQTGSIQIKTSEFNLTAIIRENIELLSENAKQKKLTVNFQVCDDCMAIADEAMITTVLRNLLNNAIKFSPIGSPINFSIALTDNFWKVSVKDKGIGISSADQQLLFDLKDGTRTIGVSKEKGTGLGLVLCKEFIELNGGKIGVESELNEGSTFFFTVLASHKNSISK